MKAPVMRLFVAVNFNAVMLDSLCKAADALKARSDSGVFTKKENFHITLAFIGETDRIADAKRVIDETVFTPFKISLGSPGRFKRDDGDIRYLSAEGEGLAALALDIAARLRKDGFDIESRAFTPHITLGRRVIDKSGIPLDIIPASMTVNRVSLMKSEMLNGGMKYTEIHYKEAII
ncbi:MAG: RNA 2',3'-cyclic phosphodiesterase [Eubacteriales bacterium]|nr:RNA 2',3'-cyclic phosphodiesterase [Eubacteriales bacterium]